MQLGVAKQKGTGERSIIMDLERRMLAVGGCNIEVLGRHEPLAEKSGAVQNLDMEESRAQWR